LEEKRIDDLGCVVFDELHMIADHHRGYIVELMATKLLCVGGDIQLVGMSATLKVPASHRFQFVLF
jgi:DNA polymerase theta